MCYLQSEQVLRTVAAVAQQDASKYSELMEATLQSWPDGVMAVVSHNGAVALSTAHEMHLSGFYARRKATDEESKPVYRMVSRAGQGVQSRSKEE